MKQLKILVSPGLAKHNITVTPKRATIKLRFGVSHDEVWAAAQFLAKVGEAVNSPQTVRGRLSIQADGYMSIRLETNGMKFYAKYTSKDFS